MTEYQTPPAPYGYGEPSTFSNSPPQQPIGPPQEALANQGPRLGARILDMLILMAAVAVVIGIAVLLQHVGPQNSAYQIAIAMICLICVLAVVCCEPYLVWKYGHTLGKRALGLRVVRLTDGRNLSAGQAFGRLGIVVLMGIVPLLPLLNLLWCCWDKPYRQCLHDKAVGSVVVKRTT